MKRLYIAYLDWKACRFQKKHGYPMTFTSPSGQKYAWRCR